MPLFVRISATDWVENGWDLNQSIQLASRLKALGVDVIDCSSGAMAPHAKIPVKPGYQVPFATKIRESSEIKTAAVGLITEPHQANEIITFGAADLVFIARESLRDPYFGLHVERALDQKESWPIAYKHALQRS